MKHGQNYTRRLRQSRMSAFTALFAMAFQFLFAVEHASAMAVSAAKGGADGTPMGILEICTARGLLRIPAPVGSGLDEQPAPRTNNGESCAVCGTTAVSGATSTPFATPIIAFPHLLQREMALPTSINKPSPGFRRSGSTRGPPLAGISRT